MALIFNHCSFCEEVVLSQISTEVLVKLRERYLSGRTPFLLLEKGDEVECLRQRMIEAIEKEIQRRLDLSRQSAGMSDCAAGNVQ
jgi:hypothetical protein